jgi:putative ABC transport system permease protein
MGDHSHKLVNKATNKPKTKNNKMFKNFLRSTFRSLWKNRSYSFLNIFGLAIGVACAGLIFLWVEDELSYDNVYAKKDLLYQVRTNQTYDGVIRTFISTPGPFAAAIRKEVPGIANAARLNRGNNLFSFGEKRINESGAYVDSNIFSMFQPEFVQGNKTAPFKDPYSLVISESMSERFFGKGVNVIGKTLKFDNQEDYVITAVVKDVPANTTLQLNWYMPFSTQVRQRAPGNYERWGSNNSTTYVELKPGVNIPAVRNQLLTFIEKKTNGEASARPVLLSMNDWRLRDKYENGVVTGGRIEYIKMFIFIAWIILLIACINFMNLATARSEKRAKEVGVRKVIGATRTALIYQFIGEALLMSFLAVIAGLAIIYLVLPAFNTLIEKKLTIGIGSPSHILSLLAIALTCGIVAGSYPAIYLSGFRPVNVLKGLKLKTGSAGWIRKALVVTQFSISIILIIGTIIIYQQIQHIKNRDLGYDRNNLLSIPSRGDIINNFTVIRQDMLATGLIENAGLNSFNILTVGNNSSNWNWAGKDDSKDLLFSQRWISPELIPTLGLKFLEGRNFGNDTQADSSNVIITKSLARIMGGGTAVGKKIYNGDDAYNVIGVVNDFVYGDMYGQSDPIVYFSSSRDASRLFVRIRSTADKKDALARMESILKKHNPAYPFEYSFLDDQFNDQFKSETLIGKLSRVFALLAITISCLGLFGLAAYMAERRTKEIGIRKVLGASVTGITGLLSKDFLRLVILSAVIAFPVAWWAMNKWLQGYAYRISISWWVFLAAAAGALFIALITVSYQSIRAALTNPVKSLRTE